MRPPSEAYSLLLRVHRGCPWNRCAFCDAYKEMKFDKTSIRPVEALKADIATALDITTKAREASYLLGTPGQVDGRVAGYLWQRHGIDISPLPYLFRYGQPKTAFLGDSNAVVVPTPALVEVLESLYQGFPNLERVTSYGRAKTLVRKSLGELQALARAGLKRLHLGLETGDDELLTLVKKGATAQEMVEAGRKVKQAGISLSEYVMPGLGGQAYSQQHALNTAGVLNAVDPDFIRFRSFVPRSNTPLYELYEQGEWALLSPHGYIQEIKLMIENLEVTSRVCFDHFINPSYKQGNYLLPLLSTDENGYQFPEQQGEVLKILDQGLRLPESGFIRAEQWINREHL